MADGKVVIDVILDDGQVVKGVANIDKRLGNINQTGRRAAAGIKEIATALGLVALGAKAIQLVNQSLDGAITRYDTLNNFPRILQQMGFDADESQKAIQRLSDGIQGLPTTLDTVVKTAQRIAIMTKDLDGAVETTLALNNAFLASGASSADAARGLEQYLQMLSTGTVDLQSWRSLQETMGVALNEVAEAFGFAGASAQNDLYEALKSGHITFDEFNEKLIELSNQTGGFAERALTATGGIRTAWTNMRTAVVRGVTEIIEAIDEVLKDTPFESIENIIKNIGDAFFNFLDGIAQSILNLKDNVGEFSSVVDLIQAAIQAFVDNVPEIIQNLINLFVENYPRMYEQGLNTTLQLINGIVDSIPQLIEGVEQIISQIIQIIIEMLPLIIDSGVRIITALIDGIVTMLPQIIETGIQLLDSIIEGIVNNLPLLVDTAVELVSLAAETILDNLPKIIEAGIDLLDALVEGIVNNLPALIQQALELVIRISGEIIKNLPKIIEAGIEIVLALIDGLIRMIPDLVTSLPQIIDAIIDTFGEVDWLQLGKDIIRGLIDGISSMASAVVDKVKSIGNSIKNGFKKVLGIASPSKIMRDEIGLWIPEGISVGIEKNSKSVLESMKGLANDLNNQAQVEFGVRNRLRGVDVPLGNIAGAIPSAQFVVNNYVNNTPYDDSRIVALLQQIAEKDPNLYIGEEKVGSVIDRIFADRIRMRGRRIALE